MKKFTVILCAFLTICLCSSFKKSDTDKYYLASNTTQPVVTNSSNTYKSPKSSKSSKSSKSPKSSKSSKSPKSSKTVKVKGYHRKDGTYVPSHTRKVSSQTKKTTKRKK